MALRSSPCVNDIRGDQSTINTQKSAMYILKSRQFQSIPFQVLMFLLNVARFSDCFNFQVMHAKVVGLEMMQIRFPMLLFWPLATAEYSHFFDYKYIYITKYRTTSLITKISFMTLKRSKTSPFLPCARSHCSAVKTGLFENANENA